MVRKSGVEAPSPRSSSKRAAPHKPTPTRQSKRAKATTTKTSYVDPSSDEETGGQDSSPLRDSKESNLSGYEHEEIKDPSSGSDQEEEASSDEEAKPRKATGKGRLSKQSTLPSHKKQSQDKGLWKSGAKLAPGTQLIIKKPRAREAGETTYTNDTIHPNTMLFLKDLAKNNDRQWLKMHDPDYRAALDDFTKFLEVLSEKVTEADETIPELPVKDIIYRIYRDVRFSKDQTPYKTYFSAAWSRTGRKGPYAAYYVQVKPNGGSFVGGGLWCPDAQPLSLLRRDIDRKPHKIKKVLTNPDIRKAFLGGVSDDERRAVSAFTNLSENKSTALKKQPKGYDKNHVDIELLRLKSFTLGTTLSDEEVVGAKGLKRIAELIGYMVPFVTYLNSVVMPDDEDSSESSDNEDERDGSSGAEGSDG